MSIIECVPNFSEGRRADVIQALVTAIQAPGVLLLDHSSDADHNRTVITVVGEPDAVLEGIFRATALAARTINLFEHRGEHPRLGATDVIPLVPISGVTLDECVDAGAAAGANASARSWGCRSICTRRRRRGQSAGGCRTFVAASSRGWWQSIHLPERAPDYGPGAGRPGGRGRRRARARFWWPTTSI
jgi:glutamate formiminotransferase